MKNKDIVKEAKEFLQQSKEIYSENRDRYLNDIRFARLGEQWPDGVKRRREQKDQPCLTFNKIPAFIRQVVNDARQNKPAINCIPVGKDSDVETAKILDGLIRNIEAQSKADIAYDTAIDNAATGGFGYLRVKIDYAYEDVFDLDICIDPVPNPLLVYADPDAVSLDGEDWMRCLVGEWVTEDSFESQYPKAEKVEFDDIDEPDWFSEEKIFVGEYWERKEVDTTIYRLSNGIVVDDERLSEIQDELTLAGIQIVEQRKSKKYKVKQYILNGQEVLEENDWPGCYIPIVPVYGEEVNEDGKRHFFSLWHHATDAQREYNYWRTSAVEKVALDTKAPWIAPVGSFATDPNWDTANIENHPYLEYDNQGIPPTKSGMAGVPASDLQLTLNASDDIKSIIGIYDAGLGARSNETSGKAIMARQKESDTSTFHFVDNRNRSIRHLGQIIVDIIPSVYSKERVVRILEEDGTPQEIAINQKFLRDGIEKIYDLTVGRYDVVVKAGPSFNSLREEAGTQMMELLRVFPDAAPIIGDLVAKNLDWPGADEIAERLKAMLPPQLQENQGIPPQVQAQLQQVQGMIQQGQEAMAKISQENQMLKVQLKDKQGELAIKDREVQIKAFEAQLKMAETFADLQQQAAELQAKANALAQPISFAS